MSQPHARRSALAPLVVLLGLGFPALASSAVASETSASDVASGLTRIQAIADSAAETAGRDSAGAEDLIDGIEPEWEKIEGAVKTNDKDAYVKLEDNFTLLKIGAKAGDATKATTASANIAGAVNRYLDQYPGPSGAAADAPSPTSDRSAAAAEPEPAPAPASPLPRTGPPASTPLIALAGMALGLGGLATIGGAPRRT